MESSKNNNNNDGEEDQQEQDCSSKKNREAMNDQDLEPIVQLPQVTGENEIADENEEEAELPILETMKIQLSKETWFDMLEFVGRRQLGQLVPQIGDRRFARIVQPFLHNYGHITLDDICIYTSCNRLIQHAVEIPENVKDFQLISLSYLDMPVINLLQKFKQKSLLGNVNLDLRLHPNIPFRINELLQTLYRILPSIDNINSIRGAHITQLVGLQNADSEMAMAMLKMARFLKFFYDNFSVPSEIEFLYRWLHTPRDDGKPRVLIFPLIPHFIDDTIKEEFATAKIPASFFIRFFVRDSVDWHDSSMENPETKEKLVVKKVATSEPTTSGFNNGQKMALISRYPLAAGKHWIEANEREAINWDFDEQNGRICLDTFI